MGMLLASGVSGLLLDFICDYLAPRRAVAVVNGATSDTIDLEHVVFLSKVQSWDLRGGMSSSGTSVSLPRPVAEWRRSLRMT